jgi:hypothetical protein
MAIFIFSFRFYRSETTGFWYETHPELHGSCLRSMGMLARTLVFEQTSCGKKNFWFMDPTDFLKMAQINKKESET